VKQKPELSPQPSITPNNNLVMLLAPAGRDAGCQMPDGN